MKFARTFFIALLFAFSFENIAAQEGASTNEPRSKRNDIVDSKLQKLLSDLDSPQPFLSDRAENEILKLGRDALIGVLSAFDAAEGAEKIQLEGLFRSLFDDFLSELDNEYSSLDSDRRELKRLDERRLARAELAVLELKFAEWTAAHKDFEQIVEDFFTLRGLKLRREKGTKAPGDEAEDFDALVTKIENAKARFPNLEKIAEDTARYYALRASRDSLADDNDVEQLRAKELTDRVASREPAVADLLGVLKDVGSIGLSEISARIEGMPLRSTPDPKKLRSAPQLLYDALLSGHRETCAASTWAEENFDARRYHESWLWQREVDSSGEHAKAAAALLAKHLDATIADLASSDSATRERASLELYRRKDHGLTRLLEEIGTDDAVALRPGSHRYAFLASLLRWRISPETYRLVGIHFADYVDLSFTARRRKVFQYARAAGDGAIATLRAMILDDGLEDSFLVKYAAAKALAAQLGDRLGYLTLKASHPELVLKRPEISRELRIIQGFAHIRAKDYALAVEEFAKILEEYPFDFDGNYHIAFAYLLLKKYAKAIHHFEIARRIHENDNLTLYNLTCAYALNGDTDKALEALEASINAGFLDADHMDKDPDLASIRETPRYRSLTKKARAKAAAGN